jgi:hypothetical protein
MRTLNARWALSSGIDYTRYVLRGSASHQLRYTRQGEIRNGRGNFENRLDLNISTSYGEVSTNILVERSSDALLNEHQFIDVTLNTRQSMQVLQIPLLLNYRIPMRHANLSFRGGPAVNMLLENTLEFTSVHAHSSGIVRMRPTRTVDLSGSKDFALGYQLGADVEIPIDRKWSVVVSPDFSGYLQPVYRDGHVIIYPHVLSIYFGAKYFIK